MAQVVQGRKYRTAVPAKVERMLFRIQAVDMRHLRKGIPDQCLNIVGRLDLVGYLASRQSGRSAAKVAVKTTSG